MYGKLIKFHCASKNKDSSSKYIKVLLNKEDISSKLKSLRLVDLPPCYLSFYFEYKDYFNYDTLIRLKV